MNKRRINTGHLFDYRDPNSDIEKERNLDVSCFEAASFSHQ